MTVIQQIGAVPMFFTGLSSDTKPTQTQGPVGQVLPNGAVFFATDTAALYTYGGQSAGWSAANKLSFF